MPYSAEHTRKARLRLLDSAVERFCKRGYDHVTLDEIARGAGLTRGAFYTHFTSKEHIYSEAICHAAAHGPTAGLDDVSGEDAVKSMIRSYLDMAHVRQDAPICPLAFLVTDVAKKEDGIRETYTGVFKETIRRMTALLPTGDSNTTLALGVMLIGAVAVARAVDDDALSRQILTACNRAAAAMIESGSAPTPGPGSE